MLRKFAVVLTGLLVLGTIIQAQDAKDKVKKKPKAPITATGTPYKVVSVNREANTIRVESDGKTMTLNVGSKTKILGPQGGKKNDGLKDQRLVPGSTIRVVMDGKDVREVYLPRRASARSSKEKTKPADEDKTEEKPKTKKSKRKPADTDKSKDKDK